MSGAPSDDARARLADWLRARFADPTLEILRHEPLAGGAIQENVALDVSREGGRRKDTLVLRTDAASGVSVSHSREREHALLAAAFDAGVTVPEPLGACVDRSVTGRPFFVMRRVAGSANPMRLTRGDAFDEPTREALVRALGSELARIHAIPLSDERLAFLSPADDAANPGATSGGATTGGAADGSSADGSGGSVLASRVARYRGLLDDLGARRPVLEWTLAWLSRQRVAPCPERLCHNDFRSGNLMVGDDGQVTGVLDWEFAAPGDPHEDIGWFCAPCWRFAARERAGGGIGSRDAFHAGYEAASGTVIDRAAVPIWEIVATVRWAVIALQQGARFTSGAEPTLELGLTGRMIAGLEQDLLVLVAEVSGCPLPAASEASVRPTRDAPDGAALLGAARAALLDSLVPSLPAERRYAAGMIANAMGIAARELTASREGEPACESPAAWPDFRAATAADDNADLFAPELLTRLVSDVDTRLALDDPRRLRH